MKCEDITKGLRVKVHTLGSTAGMIITKKNLDARREGAIGVIDGYVAGHGGDVWWIFHEDGSGVGAYSFHEFDPHKGGAPPAEEPTEPVSIFD